MATFANNIEVPTPLAPGAYDGTMQAATFEVAEPGEPENPSQLIDTDQAWGVKVDWEMHGILAKFLHATFELRILLESIGPGAELALPASVVEVDSLSAPWVAGQRVYSRKITIAAGTVPAGAYKLVTLLQLYDHANPGAKPYPVAGMVEGPIVNFFNS